MDGFDLLILGFMLREISTDLHLNAEQAAPLVRLRYLARAALLSLHML
jgi:hypothetical protein